MSQPENNTRRPLALWSSPRSMSHAFEKMMRARNDHTVFPEPFNEAWYHGPERQTHRDLPVMPNETYASRLNPILEAAKEGPVFVRQQPWQFGKKYMNKDMLCLFQGSILIRDPAYSFPSYYKLKPDFIEMEGGLIGVYEAWQILLNEGQNVPIVDAIDIQKNPKDTVAAYCDAVGIVRMPEALTWKKGSDVTWNNWTEYTETVKNSTGFQPPPKSFPVVESERLAKMIDSSRRYYREMESRKIMGAS